MSEAATGVGRLSRWAAPTWVPALDATDAAILLLLAMQAAWEGSLGLAPHAPWTMAVLIVEVGAHAFRRKAPVLVLLTVATAYFVLLIVTLRIPVGLHMFNTTGDISLWVAVYSVAALRGPRWAILAVAVEVVAYTPLLWAGPGACDAFCLVGWSALFVFAAVGGVAVFRGHRLNEELEGQTDLLRRTRQERVRLAVTQERTRVARDLHDMVAHGLTVMVVQAGAARAWAVARPDRARESLAAADLASGDALRELASLMGSLGSVPPLTKKLPPDAIDVSVRSLIDHAVRGGTHIELSIDAEPDVIDPGIEVTLYRIVQEAITNVRKHAPGARATVQILFLSETVEVEIRDSGSSTAPVTGSVPGAGQGLIGIAERAAMFGGAMEAGPTPDGGFRLRAWVPREPVAPVLA